MTKSLLDLCVQAVLQAFGADKHQDVGALHSSVRH